MIIPIMVTAFFFVRLSSSSNDGYDQGSACPDISCYGARLVRKLTVEYDENEEDVNNKTQVFRKEKGLLHCVKALFKF